LHQLALLPVDSFMYKKLSAQAAYTGMNFLGAGYAVFHLI
jgi:hypothetical protein